MGKKSLLIVLIALFALPICAKDGDQVTLQAGTANVIWTLNSAYFEINFSEAKVEGNSWDQWLQKQGDDYVRDWPSDKQKIETYFMTRFNKKTRKKGGLNLQNTNPNDAYRLIIYLDDIDMGSIGGGVVASVFLGGFAKKSGGVNLKSGYVDIVEAATGKVVCRLSFKDVRGDSGLNMTAQLILVLEDLHDELIGFAERFKDKQMPETTVSAIPTAVAAPQPAAVEAPVTVASTPAQPVSVQSKPVVQNLQTVAKPVTVTQTNIESLGNNKLLVTENPDNPERISITVGQTPIEFILVKGGRMNMGYDGNGSRKMRSEPVHEVIVTSYYISTQPIPASVVLPIVGSENVDGQGVEPAQVRDFGDVEKVVYSIASQTGLNLRLPTEAEWEYAACGERQYDIFSIARGRDTAYEWCGDFLDWYPEDRVVFTDPTGPSRGDQHVIRAYNGKRGKFDRSNDVDEDDAYLGLVRLAIKAREINVK